MEGIGIEKRASCPTCGQGEIGVVASVSLGLIWMCDDCESQWRLDPNGPAPAEFLAPEVTDLIRENS